eukprot:CAMPEP_0171685116 /NCGR_PEP_ID=MMETSP0991-20121206/2072_1 /TAXON_ID=483369 /ORGANISM="non described non described, Strain CCMP2098" /LENGTH=319 /DNA_ID=CAMNT_0012272733 /DNA_START=162 /DNA_END=1117 /DNA_ORIENTATION=-
MSQTGILIVLAILSFNTAFHCNERYSPPRLPVIEAVGNSEPESKREQKREARREERVQKRKQATGRDHAFVDGLQCFSMSNKKERLQTTPTARARKLREAAARSEFEALANEGPTLVIDCAWDKHMTAARKEEPGSTGEWTTFLFHTCLLISEVSSVCIELVKVTSFQNLCFLLFNSANISPFSQIPQIKLCYGLNRRSERPARLLLTSLGGDVEAGLSQLDGWGGVTDTFDGSSTSSSSSKCGCREGIVESSSLSSDAAVCAEATKTRGGGSWLAFAATSLSLEALLTPKALTKTKVRVSTDGDKRMAESFSSSSSSS